MEVKSIQTIHAFLIAMADGYESRLGSIVRIACDPPPLAVEADCFQYLTNPTQADDKAEIHFAKVNIHNYSSPVFVAAVITELSVSSSLVRA
jgi:hypothetical protein